MQLGNGKNMLIKLSHWDAAKAAGVYQLQGLHWHGYHILGCRPSMDHDAFLHVAKYLRDHGIHRQTREGGKDRRSVREVSLHTVTNAAYTAFVSLYKVSQTLSYFRLAWVIGFTMGPFPGNERTWKPFNPILGETFELTMDNGLRFIAEQVCSCSV